MDDFFKELEQLCVEQDIINNIITELPDCVPAALTIISMVIDKYSAKHNLSSSLVWKALTEVSEEVHKEFGDYEL